MAIPTMLSGAAGHALRTLEPLEAVARTDGRAARALINAARGDIVRGLGTARVSSFSAELHAHARTLHANGRGSAGAGAGIGAGLQELAAAARSTAARRIAVGALAVGAGIAGALAIARQRDGERQVPMAPGPFGERPAPIQLA